jgi:hypothetical protein
MILSIYLIVTPAAIEMTRWSEERDGAISLRTLLITYGFTARIMTLHSFTMSVF